MKGFVRVLCFTRWKSKIITINHSNNYIERILTIAVYNSIGLLILRSVKRVVVSQTSQYLRSEKTIYHRNCCNASYRVDCHIREHISLCPHVPSGKLNQLLASSVAQTSSHLPRYVRTKFGFRNSGPAADKPLCYAIK